MTFYMPCGLLPQTNTSPELVQYICDHDIRDPAVQRHFPTQFILGLDVRILGFLSRAGARPTWRTDNLALIITHQQPSEYELIFGKDKDRVQTYSDSLRQQRLDQCCSNLAMH